MAQREAEKLSTFALHVGDVWLSRWLGKQEFSLA